MLSRQEWSIPKVQPRPSVFSIESLILWLEQQPPDKRYDYHDCRGACLYGQYMAAHGYSWEQARGKLESTRAVYRFAHAHPWTFGAALDRARQALVA